MLDMSGFFHRLIINLFLFLAIRFLTLKLDLHIPNVAISKNFYRFLLNITLGLEISICVLVAEIYMLVVSNQQIRLRNETLQRINAETTFEVLKNQINPHFLFNSLNTLSAMIDTNSETAKAFINNMSHIYRYVLNSVDKPVVTLAEEMEFAMAYTNMLQERHIGSLHVYVNVSSQHMVHLLPPMSLQILLENAVKHNVVSTRQPLEVIIETKNNYLTVNNRIQEKKVKPPSTGTGLYNLNQRYIYLCKKEININRSGTHFSVSLPLLGQ
ncbi:sensor histidine kinase [Niastella caeni]|nr:histidine kinase [Niastella caeni]